MRDFFPTLRNLCQGLAWAPLALAALAIVALGASPAARAGGEGGVACPAFSNGSAIRYLSGASSEWAREEGLFAFGLGDAAVASTMNGFEIATAMRNGGDTRFDGWAHDHPVTQAVSLTSVRAFIALDGRIAVRSASPAHVFIGSISPPPPLTQRPAHVSLEAFADIEENGLEPVGLFLAQDFDAESEVVRVSHFFSIVPVGDAVLAAVLEHDVLTKTIRAIARLENDDSGRARVARIILSNSTSRGEGHGVFTMPADAPGRLILAEFDAALQTVTFVSSAGQEWVFNFDNSNPTSIDGLASAVLPSRLLGPVNAARFLARGAMARLKTPSNSERMN